MVNIILTKEISKLTSAWPQSQLVQTCNTQEAEEGELRVPGHSGMHSAMRGGGEKRDRDRDSQRGRDTQRDTQRGEKVNFYTV